MIEATYRGVYFHGELILKFHKWHWSYVYGTTRDLKRSPKYFFPPSTHLTDFFFKEEYVLKIFENLEMSS